MQEIAVRSGVSLPAIYRRWPSKVELVTAAVFVQTERRPVDPAAEFFAELRFYIESAIATICDPVTVAAFPGIVLDVHNDQTLQDRFFAAFNPEMQPFKDLVSNAVAGRVITTDMTADQLNVIIIGAAVGWALTHPGESSVSLGDLVYEVTCRALQPRTAPA